MPRGLMFSQNSDLTGPGLGMAWWDRGTPGSESTLPWHGWLQKEEELRKEEERKKALDERLRFEQERMEQERQEQEERERRYREREQQIEEHRCAQPGPAAGPALPQAGPCGPSIRVHAHLGSLIISGGNSRL